MEVPYERGGRSGQKRRTREALVAEARSLLSEGTTPTVEQVADAAGISRTTAYRYFPNQRALVLAAVPLLEQTSMLGAHPPPQTADRLDLVIAAQIQIMREYEPQLRAALRFSLDPAASGGSGSDFRKGRAIGWFAEALSPLASTHPGVDRQRLALAIRACCGIETLAWLVDVAGLSREGAYQIMRRSARSLLAAEVTGVAGD